MMTDGILCLIPHLDEDANAHHAYLQNTFFSLSIQDLQRLLGFWGKYSLSMSYLFYFSLNEGFEGISGKFSLAKK